MLDSSLGAVGDLPRHIPEKPRLQAEEHCGSLVRGMGGHAIVITKEM